MLRRALSAAREIRTGRRESARPTGRRCPPDTPRGARNTSAMSMGDTSAIAQRCALRTHEKLSQRQARRGAGPAQDPRRLAAGDSARALAGGGHARNAIEFVHDGAERRRDCATCPQPPRRARRRAARTSWCDRCTCTAGCFRPLRPARHCSAERVRPVARATTVARLLASTRATRRPADSSSVLSVAARPACPLDLPL